MRNTLRFAVVFILLFMVYLGRKTKDGFTAVTLIRLQDGTREVGLVGAVGGCSWSQSLSRRERQKNPAA